MRRNIHAAPAAVLATALLAATAPVLAQQGQRPIYQSTNIFESGYYKFTRNVAAGGAPVITVSVGPEDRVVIDLNCFTATQLSTNVPVIHISSGGSIVIKNGELQNGTNGIQVVPGFTDSLSVSDLHIRNTFADGIVAGPMNRFDGDNVIITNTGDDSLDLDEVKEVDLNDMMMGPPGDDGLDLFGGVSGTSGTINRVTVIGAGNRGFALDNFSGWLSNVTTRNSAQDGIFIQNSSDVWSELAAVQGAGGHGIHLQTSLRVSLSEFDASEVAFDGISLDATSSDISLDGGTASGNANGIVIHSDRTVVRDVEAINNTQVGVHVTASASDTVVRGSTGIGNTVWDLLAEGFALVTFQNLFGTIGP